MTIHAVDKNIAIDNVIIDYRDRQEGSVSKLNTYNDGVKVLKMIGHLYKNCRPLEFFGLIAVGLAIISAIMFFPVLYICLLYTSSLDKVYFNKVEIQRGK